MQRFRSSNIPALLLLGFGVLCGVVAGVIGWQNGAAMERNSHYALRLERLLSTLKDLETGQRGFLLTGDEAYLTPYNAAVAVLDGQLADLAALDLPLDDLADLVHRRRDSAEKGIAIYRAAGPAAAVPLVRNGRGKALMDQIRAFVQSSQGAADARVEELRWRDHWIAAPIGAVGVIALGLAFALLMRSTIRRRRAQRESAALLEGVLDNAPVGLGFLDTTLRFQQMNRALRTMSERALNAGIGRSLWDAMPALRETLEARVSAVVSGGRPLHNLDLAVADRTSEGETRHFQASFYPLRGIGARQGIEGAGVVLTDVTARRRSEQHLRESEERFRTLTESVASIVWVTDGQGRFDKPQAEWAAFTGQDFEAHRNDGWLDAVHPDDREAVQIAWSAALAGRATFRIEHRLRRADGAWRHVAANGVPIRDEADHCREWVGSHTDITERKEAELELAAAKDAAEAANRAKSVFLANMSHELRTPLSAVIGYSEMMEEEVCDLGIDSLATDLGKIRTNARHLLSLINDVLDLSKIEANRMDVFAEDIDVATLVGEVASTVGALVQKKGNALVLGPTEGLGTMRTDGVKLRQCLFNLVSNAAKFTEDGKIRLDVTRAAKEGDDRFRFRVSDTGIGMTPEQVARLFQRFSQADETTTRRFGGTGLGLAITRAFCRLLGGDVEVASVAGQGSSFTIDLPADMPDPQELEREPLDHEAGAEASGRVVLVIDDDAAQRDMTTRFLERQGFVAQSAADGETGLALARTLKPRAILLDVMMPRMDGWAVLTALKADPELARIPVVMVTFVQDKGLGSALGASDYLIKPVQWEKLKAVLDRFVEAEGDVLIVDDDVDARERLRAVLERGGWTVQEAANGQEALDRVSDAVPRLILLDLTMPVMDGFTFLEALRDRPGCGDVPVVVLTARDLSAGDRRRLEVADRVLSKGSASLSEITHELRALAPPAGEAVAGPANG